MISMKMSDGGRVVVPVEIRRSLGIADGDIVFWELRDGEAHLTTRRAQLKKAQTLFQQVLAPNACSVVDELIAERRAEAVRE